MKIGCHGLVWTGTYDAAGIRHAVQKTKEAEAARAAAEVAEAEAKRVAAQTAIVQTRQLRDSLNWLRASARWPKESLPRCAASASCPARLTPRRCTLCHHQPQAGTRTAI